MKILSTGDVELEGTCNRGRRWMSLGGGAPPDTGKTGTCVVLCHPHPYLGGNMRNPFMTHLARRLSASGVTAVRFNFRGCGFSGGKRTWARVGERDDACAAVRHAANLPWIDPKRVFLFGYSFGSAVALAAMDELRDECAGFIGCAHPWGVRAMLVPSQPPCASGKPKLFFHAVNDVVLSRKASGKASGNPDHNPEFTRLRQPRRVAMLKTDHSFAGRYVDVCEHLVDWLDNPHVSYDGRPGSSSDEGVDRYGPRGSDSPESFSSDGSGGRGRRLNGHPLRGRRSARGGGQHLSAWDDHSQDLTGFRTDSTSSLSQHAPGGGNGRGERKSLRDGLPTIHSQGRDAPHSLRSSLSTGSGGSGLSVGTGSDVSLDSQGRPRHRVGPASRVHHVPGDATPDYRVHGGVTFPTPGDRTPDYRTTGRVNDANLAPRYKHVLPQGDHAVQEYMRARLRQPRSSDTDAEGSVAVSNADSNSNDSSQNVWSANGAPPLVNPGAPPPGARRAIPPPIELPPGAKFVTSDELAARYGGGGDRGGLSQLSIGDGEGSQNGERPLFRTLVVKDRDSRESSQNGQNPMLKGVLEKEGIAAEYRRQDYPVGAPTPPVTLNQNRAEQRDNASSGSETDAPTGRGMGNRSDSQKSILKRVSSVGKKMDRGSPDPEDEDNRVALLKIFGGKSRNPFRRAATAVMAANRFVAAGQKRVIWAGTTAEGQPIVDTNSRKPTRRNFRAAARATIAMNRFKAVGADTNHEKPHFGWHGKAPMDPEARRAMNYSYQGSRSNSPAGSAVDGSDDGSRRSRSPGRSNARVSNSRSPSRDRSRERSMERNAGRTPMRGHRRKGSGF